MASNLYEVLGLDRTATSEDIRKAYRKRALKTHPDRLPPGVSETERQTANEQFRLVNNAYEVLTDPTNRKLYDTHGVWPPPSVPPSSSSSTSSTYSPYSQSHYQTQTQTGPSGRANSFPFGPFPSPFDTDPFFTSRDRSHPRPHSNFPPSPFGGGWHFTDPFELFNSLFGDTRRPGFSWSSVDDFDDPFFSDSRGGGGVHFGPLGFGGPFGGGMFGGGPPGGGPRDPFGRPLMSMMGPFSPPFSHPLLQFTPSSSNSNANVRSYSSSTSMSSGGEGQWVSQSTMTRSVNGRSETVVKRRDAQGNEHVTYTSPEGERYTINGVEQPSGSGRGLPSSSQAPQAQQIQNQALPPAPQMQGAGAFPPPFAPQQVGRSQSANRHSTSSSYYDQPDAQRPSSTHHKSSRNYTTDGHPSHRSSHNPSQNPSYAREYDSPSSSSRRNKIYAPPGDRDRDSGHHVGDSGSRHHVGDSGSRHREDGRSAGGGGSGGSGSGRHGW